MELPNDPRGRRNIAEQIPHASVFGVGVEGKRADFALLKRSKPALQTVE